jgi:hypothetical protein
VRMVNASSSLILCRSISMPFACSITARDIIATRRLERSSLVLAAASALPIAIADPGSNVLG